MFDKWNLFDGGICSMEESTRWRNLFDGEICLMEVLFDGEIC